MFEISRFFFNLSKTFRLSDDVNLDSEFDECDRKPYQFFSRTVPWESASAAPSFPSGCISTLFFNPIYFQMNMYLVKKKLFLK